MAQISVKIDDKLKKKLKIFLLHMGLTYQQELECISKLLLEVMAFL